MLLFLSQLFFYQIIVDMKKILFFSLLIGVAAMLGSCGAAGSASRAEKDTRVNVGYSVTTQDDLTYSVSSVKPDEKEMVYSNMYDYLRGRVAGVQVFPDNSIRIRGINSINSSTEPLLVVDGAVVTNLDAINPHDVYSVDVLKDASSSIYGVRGANGVIIITTKSGRNQK